MLRKLSAIERFACMMGQDEPLLFALMARFAGPISTGSMENALRKVRRKHPLASARVTTGPEGEPWFTSTELEPTPLQIIDVDEGSGELWLTLVPKEVARLTDPANDPLVRFIWIRGTAASDLVVLCHHAVADGLSAAYLVRDLLTFLGDPKAEIRPLPLLPAMEELIPPEIEAQVAAAVSSEAKTPMTRRSPGRKNTPGVPNNSTFRLLDETFGTGQTEQLSRKAREQETSVHGAIGAAFLLSCAEKYGDSSGFARTLISPISVRHMLAQPVREGFGLFAGQVNATVDCSPDREFWEVARDVRAGLLRQSTPQNILRPLVRFKQMIKLGLSVETMYKLHRHSQTKALGPGGIDVTVSNLGHRRFPKGEGSIQVRSLHGTFSAMSNGKIVVAFTVKGRLTLTFIHDESGFARETADVIFADACDRLQTAI